jgi:hypothetical protein
VSRWQLEICMSRARHSRIGDYKFQDSETKLHRKREVDLKGPETSADPSRPNNHDVLVRLPSWLEEGDLATRWGVSVFTVRRIRERGD